MTFQDPSNLEALVPWKKLNFGQDVGGICLTMYIIILYLCMSMFTEYIVYVYVLDLIYIYTHFIRCLYVNMCVYDYF